MIPNCSNGWISTIEIPSPEDDYYVMTVWIIAAKLIHQAQGVKFRAVTDQPLFYLALVAVILGVMLFLAGFVGEMIARSSEGRNNYQIKERI